MAGHFNNIPNFYALLGAFLFGCWITSGKPPLRKITSFSTASAQLSKLRRSFVKASGIGTCVFSCRNTALTQSWRKAGFNAALTKSCRKAGFYAAFAKLKPSFSADSLKAVLMLRKSCVLRSFYAGANTASFYEALTQLFCSFNSKLRKSCVKRSFNAATSESCILRSFKLKLRKSCVSTAWQTNLRKSCVSAGNLCLLKALDVDKKLVKTKAYKHIVD